MTTKEGAQCKPSAEEKLRQAKRLPQFKNIGSREASKRSSRALVFIREGHKHHGPTLRRYCEPAMSDQANRQARKGGLLEPQQRPAAATAAAGGAPTCSVEMMSSVLNMVRSDSSLMLMLSCRSLSTCTAGWARHYHTFTEQQSPMWRLASPVPGCRLGSALSLPWLQHSQVHPRACSRLAAAL